MSLRFAQLKQFFPIFRKLLPNNSSGASLRIVGAVRAAKFAEDFSGGKVREQSQQ
jgi:hypothetical protein